MSSQKTIFPQLAAGTLLGTQLGIAGFITFMGYGGNYGCFPVVDYIFGLSGYESCGIFGSVTGVLVGSLVGIILARNIRWLQSKKATLSAAIITPILPFLFASFLFWPIFEDDDILIAFPVILYFMLFSFITSIFVVGVVTLWRKIWNRQKKYAL